MSFEELPMAGIGPEDAESFFGEGETSGENVIELSGFVPKQKTPSQELKGRVAVSMAAGTRKVMSVIDVMEDDEQLEFIIEGLLPNTGMMYVGGLSGTGKTILAIQVAGNAILGRPTMTWKLGTAAKDKPIRALFLSLEMGKKELQLRLQHIYPNLSEEEEKIFDDSFLTYTEPEPIRLWDSRDVVDLINMIKAYDVNLLIIDSASVSFGSSLNDDKEVNASLDNLRTIRVRLNVAMIVVSHTRKPPAGIASHPEDITLNDLFGHSGVAQSASAIVIMIEDEKSRKETIRSGKMNETEKKVHIINAKARFDANGGAFISHLTSKNAVDRGEPLIFKRNAIPIAMSERQKEKARKTKAPSFKEALKGIDFGSIGGTEDA